jgi:hypothetical protein
LLCATLLRTLNSPLSKAGDNISAISLGTHPALFPEGSITAIVLVVNKPLKQRFKQLYTAYKLRNDPGAGKKVKVKRDDVLLWLEQAICEFNEKNIEGRLLEKSFKKYGQDFRVDGFSEEFKAHLHSLSGHLRSSAK